MCHLTVMKLIHGVVAAVVASVLPTAMADEQAPKAKPFSIAFSGDIKPVAHGDLRYPSYAGSRNPSGSCDVSFAINEAGEADAIRIRSCSSEAFRFAAKSTVQAVAFAPRAKAVDGVKMQIRWTLGEQAALQTAGLD